ncbi:MAG: hypothetical protein AAF492_21045 [Verrucomicrobiota bacterium]
MKRLRIALMTGCAGWIWACSAPAQSIFENYDHGPITIEEKNVVYLSKDLAELYIHANKLIMNRFLKDRSKEVDNFIQNTGRRHGFFLNMKSPAAPPENFLTLREDEFALRIARKNAESYITRKYGEVKAKKYAWYDGLVEFGRYDFSKGQFPLDISIFPVAVESDCLDLYFHNAEDFPGLVMTEKEGMEFIAKRKDIAGSVDRKLPSIFVFSIEEYRDTFSDSGTLLSNSWYRFDPNSGMCQRRLKCKLKSIYVYENTDEGVKLLKHLQPPESLTRLGR